MDQVEIGSLNGPTPDVPKHKLNLNAKFAPVVLLGGLILFSATGCVYNPHAGDVLVADRTIYTAFCDIQARVQITLNDSRVIQVAGGQQDLVWNVSVPGCSGDVSLAGSVVQTSFSRP